MDRRDGRPEQFGMIEEASGLGLDVEQREEIARLLS